MASCAKAPYFSNAQLLSNQLRLLWEQHVYWTRMVILGIVFDLPDAQFTTNRLLRNPGDFEAALRPFYEETITQKFADLFTSHLKIAGELVTAAKDGDNATAADAEKRWYANAEQIAEFLACINPYWTKHEWVKKLNDHLAMTKKEAVNLLTQRYEESIRTFDRIEQEALLMADLMTNGIRKQFLNHFCC